MLFMRGGGIARCIYSNSHAHNTCYIVYVNVDLRIYIYIWTTEVEKFPYQRICTVWLYGVLFFLVYDINSRYHHCLLKLWCSFMTLRACVDHYLNCLYWCYGCIDVYVCLPVSRCVCARSNDFMCAGMPANEIETETIWMNKLHYAEDKWKIF